MTFLLRNQPNSYSVGGNAALSQKYFSDSDDDFGHTFDLSLAKTSGTIQWNASYLEQSNTYDPNDLGFLLSNNTRTFQASGSYNIFKPFGKFNRASINANFAYRRIYDPNVFSNLGIGVGFFMVTKNFMGFGVNSSFEPKESFDYFEPRLPDFSRYYRFPKTVLVSGFISSDYRKKVAYDLNTLFRKYDEDGRYLFTLNIAPR